MTRTDVMASSRPQTEGAVSMRSGRSGVLRRLSALSAVLLLALTLALPGTAFAAEEPTAGYNQTPTTPKTGTSPSKEEKSPASEPAPEKSTTTTTPTTATKSSTLPFTGFDLRWSLAVGVLLMGAGFSIVAVQRRQCRGDHS
jgi:hypothetical protein